jgi:hypothetical protein
MSGVATLLEASSCQKRTQSAHQAEDNRLAG